MLSTFVIEESWQMYALILTMVAMQGNVSNMGPMAVTYDASAHIWSG